MNDQANVYRIRKNKNSFWFFKDWNGCEPVWYAPSIQPRRQPLPLMKPSKSLAVCLNQSSRLSNQGW